MGKGMSVVASQAVQLEKTLASGDHETASTKALFFGQPKPLRRSGVLRSAQTCGFPARWTGVQQAEARQRCISSLHRQRITIRFRRSPPSRQALAPPSKMHPRVAIRVLWENLRPSCNAVA